MAERVAVTSERAAGGEGDVPFRKGGIDRSIRKYCGKIWDVQPMPIRLD